MAIRKVVIDTNAFTALMTGTLAVKEAIESAKQVFIPTFVLGELLFGFKNGNKEQWNTEILNNFLSLPGVSILNTSEETADIYAELLLSLKQKGKSIPTNDIWIAAVAVETGSVIITYDKHFLYIDQVRIWTEITRKDS